MMMMFVVAVDDVPTGEAMKHRCGGERLFVAARHERQW